MDCSLPGSSVHGIFQARILEWVVISFPRGSSGPRNQTHVSCVCCIGRRIPYHCAMWEAPLSLGHPLKEGGDSYFGLHFKCLVAIYTLHRLSVFKLFAHLLHFRNGLFDIIKCETDRQFRLDAWDKCSGLVHWDDPDGWDGEGSGGGFRMGNTCKSMADSCQCVAKTTTIL